MKMFLPLLLLINIAFAGFPPPIQKPLSATVGAIPLFANVLGSKVTELPVCTSGQFVGSNGSAFICGTPSGTVSASLTLADAATTYRTDNAGNTYSVWTGQPQVKVALIDAPVTAGFGVAWSSNGKYLAKGINASPYIEMYIRADNIFRVFAVANISAGGNTIRGLDFSNDGVHLVGAHSSSPFYTMWKRGTTAKLIFTSLTTPLDIAPTGAAIDAKYNFDGSILAIAHATTPFVSFYTHSGDAYTKIANPGTLPTGQGNGICWSRDGAFVAITHTTSPFLTVYSVSGTTFTKLSNPATLPTGNGGNCAWSTDNTYLVVTHTTAPSISIYKRTGSGGSSTLTKLTDPATLPTATDVTNVVGSVEWNHGDDSFILTTGNTGATTIMPYDHSGDTFTYRGRPAGFDLIVGMNPAVNSTKLSPNGEFLAITAQSLDGLYVLKMSGEPPVKIFKKGYE